MFAGKFSFEPVAAPKPSVVEQEETMSPPPAEKKPRVRFEVSTSSPAASPRKYDKTVAFESAPLLRTILGQKKTVSFFFPALIKRGSTGLSRELLEGLKIDATVVLETYVRVDRVLLNSPARLDFLLCAPTKLPGSAAIAFFYKQSPHPPVVPGAMLRLIGRPNGDLFQAYAIFSVACPEELSCAGLRARLQGETTQTEP